MKQKRWKQWIAMLMVLVMVLTVFRPNEIQAETAGEMVFDVNSYYRITSKESNKVMEVHNLGMYNGDQIQQWEYTRAESQQWQIVKEGNYFKIRNKNSSKLLSVQEGTAQNGDSVFQWDDMDSDTQLWYLEYCENGFYQIKSKENDKCIDIKDISKNNGAKLQLWEDVDGNNQMWQFSKLEEDRNILSGGKYKITSKNSGKAMEIGYNSQEDGGTVQQWDYEYGNNQQWFLQKVEEKYFKIIADHSGKVLTVKNHETNNGTAVEQRAYESKDSQLWYFELDSNGYYKIKSKQSGKCLEVSRISMENGAALQIWEDGDGDNQKWNMKLLSYLIDPAIHLSADYEEDTNAIKVEWYGDEDLVTSSLYIRRNQEEAFIEYSVKQQGDTINCNANAEENEITEEVEEETANRTYRETISLESNDTYVEFRVMGTTKYGLELLSDIVTLQQTETGVEVVPRDSDSDGIEDGYEIWDLETNPYETDSDEDGFPDGYEVLVLCTNPNTYTEDEDFDKDGFSNLEEMDLGTNPYLSDSDFDGILDKEDEEPLKTDVHSNREVNYDITIQTGYYDKVLSGYDEEGKAYQTIYNSILKGFRYTENEGECKQYQLYDNNGKQTAALTKEGNNWIAHTYTYDANENMTYMTHNGFGYTFEYDENQNITKGMVEDQVLFTSDYNSETNTQGNIVYGNGQKKEYVYDETGEKIEQIDINNALAYSYNYDDSGNVTSLTDHRNEIEYTYRYNEEGTLISLQADNGFSITYETEESRTKTTYTIDGVTKTQEVNVNEEEATATTTFSGGKMITKTEENKEDVIQVYNQNNTKIMETKVSAKQDNVIKFENQSGETFCYKYNNKGNLIKVYENNTLISQYHYDGINQLIREDNQKADKTTIYTYDNGGNIRSVKEYPYTTGTPSEHQLIQQNQYQYGNNAWKDLFTSYNGQEITYDAIGNPLQYRDGYRFTWNDGRLLGRIEKGNEQIQYFYNQEGLRTKKVANGVTTEYHLDGSKIIGETTGNSSTWYYYDNKDSVIGFEKDGQVYYYEKNILNDIVAIYNQAGNKIVGYTYDAYGNITSITGDGMVAQSNPFTYRGYYRDRDTGLYYLQNRYYDSQTGRFLNADIQFDYNADTRWANLFCYVANNPIAFCDPTGTSISAVIFTGLVIVAFTIVAYTSYRFYVNWIQNSGKITAGFIKAVNATLKIPSKLAHWTYGPIQVLWGDILNSFEKAKTKAKPRYKRDFEDHHIVAHSSPRAKGARDVLRKLNINVEKDKDNLVRLKTGFHKRLHRKLYYSIVNTLVCGAYNTGKTTVQKRKNVRDTLSNIKDLLRSMNQLAPW